ncbi:MAG: short-chain dehydrogenase [Nitrosomonadales bacterium]|nr:short-chain dehydrogenase [Nitrosomonadales bacterium]|tara:strand:- start:992 stop:1678 length:687 start_codon:yes stop_codon:yes gene_type:complete
MNTILVTGANRGLGYEFVKQYSETGFNVLACCRNISQAKNLKILAEESKNIEIYELDVGNIKNIMSLSKQLEDKKIDVLINNAGIYRSSTVGNINYDEWLESFKINTIAPYQIVEAFLNQIINSDLKKVVSITSKMGSIDDNTSGGSYIYRSSKTALNSMMQSLSHDIKHHGIATLTLHPGWVRTDMGGMGGWIDAHESVQGMIKQIEKLTINNSGKYIDYAGKSINW